MIILTSNRLLNLHAYIIMNIFHHNSLPGNHSPKICITKLTTISHVNSNNILLSLYPQFSSFPVSSRFHKVQRSYIAAFRVYELLAGYESDVSSLSRPEREIQMEEDHHNYQFRSASSNRWVFKVTAASSGSPASHRATGLRKNEK